MDEKRARLRADCASDGLRRDGRKRNMTASVDAAGERTIHSKYRRQRAYGSTACIARRRSDRCISKSRTAPRPTARANLCATCRLSTIVRGRSLDEEIVQCHARAMRTMRVTFKVTFCSAYSDARQPTYMQMLEDAWILQPGSKKRPAGFIRGADLKQEELSAHHGRYPPARRV